jgi:hypothetical protein
MRKLITTINRDFMKKVVLFLLAIQGSVALLAQQNLGIRNSNYAGIQGALLNPSSIADSKLEWDVNALAVDEVFDNNFFYIPKNSLTFFGFNKIVKGIVNEDLFYTEFDPNNPNKLYNLTFSTEVLGPSFFVKILKKHVVGLTISDRSYANIKNIPGNVAQNAFAYLVEPDLWNTTFHDSTSRINSMNWLEYGVHYAAVLYSKGRDELKGGISLNYLQGVAAAYTNHSNYYYKIVDTSNIIFTNTNIDYGRTDINTYQELNHGHGIGMDLGFTYLHLKDPDQMVHTPDSKLFGGNTNDYVYRIGISLIDIGHINFNRNSASFHLQGDSANLTNWHEAKFSSNDQFDKTLSAIFYNGDSTQSLTANHFKMAMPSALSLQADWNVYQNFYANLTIIKGFGHGSNPGVRRPDIYSLTPRYETLWGEVSLPMSLMYYGLWKPRIGIAVRIAYFFIGGDSPWGLLIKTNNLDGVDFYAGIHIFMPEKKKTSDEPLFQIK